LIGADGLVTAKVLCRSTGRTSHEGASSQSTILRRSIGTYRDISPEGSAEIAEGHSIEGNVCWHGNVPTTLQCVKQLAVSVVDRGSDSRGAMDLVASAPERRPASRLLLGNQKSDTLNIMTEDAPDERIVVCNSAGNELDSGAWMIDRRLVPTGCRRLRELCAPACVAERIDASSPT
jgi:hypothetical protein